MLPVEPKGTQGETEFSFISVSADNVTLEAVKKCEDENAVIVRFVEKTGRTTPVTAKLFAQISKVAECDLLERNDVPYDDFSGDTIKFISKPFEIKCFKVFVK